MSRRTQGIPGTETEPSTKVTGQDLATESLFLMSIGQDQDKMMEPTMGTDQDLVTKEAATKMIPGMSADPLEDPDLGRKTIPRVDTDPGKDP